MLSQEEQGQENAIYYFSKKLLNYESMQKLRDLNVYMPQDSC